MKNKEESKKNSVDGKQSLFSLSQAVFNHYNNEDLYDCLIEDYSYFLHLLMKFKKSNHPALWVALQRQLAKLEVYNASFSLNFSKVELSEHRNSMMSDIAMKLREDRHEQSQT